MSEISKSSRSKKVMKEKKGKKEKSEEIKKIAKQEGEKPSSISNNKEELSEERTAQEAIRSKLIENRYERSLLEMDSISSSELQEASVIHHVLEDELSELDGELSEINSSLEVYAKVISEHYRQEIQRAFKEFGFKSKQLRLGGDFSFKRSDFENDDKFEEIVNSRGQYLWYGLVYKITEILPGNLEGETIAGFTTSSMSSRWANYVLKAVFQQGKGGKLHKLIYDFLYQVGFENLRINRKYNWRLIFGLLDSRFKRTPVEIHFSLNSLRLGEANYIADHDLINSGLNIKSGGEGGRDKKDLPMISIAYYISLGYMENEIQKKLNDYGIRCNVNMVRRRIREYWGSFEEAQIKFLRPVFYMFLKNHFDLHEINNAFNRFTLGYIETMFGNKSYKDLKKLVDTENLLDLPVINKLDGWEGITKLRIPADLLRVLLLEYATMNKAIKDLRVQKFLQEYECSYYRYAFIRQIHNQLGQPTWEEARKEFVLPYIIKDFRSDQSFSTIYQNYGWSESYAKDHNRISQTIFLGMKSTQVRQFLRDHPTIDTYDEFKELFLNEKARSLEDLPLTILNELIFKHVDIDKAQQELNSMGYGTFNFREQVERYYSSWRDAFKEVKIPFLINTFRRGKDPIESYIMIGYSRVSATYHNNISKRLFFGANTEMVRLFLDMNPQISTLENFEIAYKQGFLEKKD